MAQGTWDALDKSRNCGTLGLERIDDKMIDPMWMVATLLLLGQLLVLRSRLRLEEEGARAL